MKAIKRKFPLRSKVKITNKKRDHYNEIGSVYAISFLTFEEPPPKWDPTATAFREELMIEIKFKNGDRQSYKLQDIQKA